MNLREIRELIGDCIRCRLSKHRTHIVFGQGNPDADIMFIGEAPGDEEDRNGLAFVGRAGKLLTELIVSELKMTRDQVFIANCIKCRPPDNRNPEPDELAACQPFIEQQIDTVKPYIIVALGKFAAQFLLKTTTPISRLRGTVAAYNDINVVPTFHPAYVLRNPDSTRFLRDDLQLVKRVLDKRADPRQMDMF